MLSHFTSVTSKQSNSQGRVCLSLEGMILGDPHSGTYRPLLNTQDNIHINEKQFLSDCNQCALHHSHMCAEINRENDQFRLRENTAGENGKPRPHKRFTLLSGSSLIFISNSFHPVYWNISCLRKPFKPHANKKLRKKKWHVLIWKKKKSKQLLEMI